MVIIIVTFRTEAKSNFSSKTFGTNFYYRPKLVYRLHNPTLFDFFLILIEH